MWHNVKAAITCSIYMSVPLTLCGFTHSGALDAAVAEGKDSSCHRGPLEADRVDRCCKNIWFAGPRRAAV